MNELVGLKKRITDLFDAGDIEALNRIYAVMTDIMAHLCILRGILDPPKPPEEEKLELEPYQPAPGKKGGIE